MHAHLMIHKYRSNLEKNHEKENNKCKIEWPFNLQSPKEWMNSQIKSKWLMYVCLSHCLQCGGHILFMGCICSLKLTLTQPT